VKRVVRRELEAEAYRAIKSNRKPCSVRTVSLSGGQSLILVHSGNFFELSQEETALIVGIVDAVERFQVARQLAGTDSKVSPDSEKTGKG
jgi:hypothetical protein